MSKRVHGSFHSGITHLEQHFDLRDFVGDRILKLVGIHRLREQTSAASEGVERIDGEERAVQEHVNTNVPIVTIVVGVKVDGEVLRSAGTAFSPRASTEIANDEAHAVRRDGLTGWAEIHV